MVMYKSYQHIEKMGSSEIDGILIGDVSVFTKMDGTNFTCFLKDDGTLGCGSRNREISLTSDNQGACAWAYSQDNILSYLKKHPKHILYGEFMVKHLIRTYEDDVWKKAFVFDVFDTETEKYLSYEEYKPLLEEFSIEYIPRIAKLHNPTMEEVESYVDKCDFKQVGDNSGEGIVVKNFDYRTKWGHIIWGKIVRAEYKQKNKAHVTGTVDIETDIIDKYCTDAFVLKEVDKIYSALGTWDNKYIGRYINTVWHEFITENMWDIIKKCKNPTINFRVMFLMCQNKTKSIMKSYFAQKNVEVPF